MNPTFRVRTRKSTTLTLGKRSYGNKPGRFKRLVLILSLLSLVSTLIFLFVQAARRKANNATSRPTASKPPKDSTKTAPPEDKEAEGLQKKKRRYAIPLPVDAATGEVLDTATRKSRRAATVQSKKELHIKLKDEQEKRVRVSHNLVR